MDIVVRKNNFHLMALLMAILLLIYPMQADAAGFFKTADEEIIIVVDPGHGGYQEGCMYEYDGQMILEKDINLDIALALRDELASYQHVKVILTRDSDVEMGLQERADLAFLEDADYYVSVHINARDDEKDEEISRGAMVIVPYGSYQAPAAKCPNINGVTSKLAEYVLNGLTAVGLQISHNFDELNIGGVLRRPYSEEGDASETKYYPDDSVSDYYGQMRFNMEYGIPAILIEHAYLSSEADYREYLETKEQREILGRTDARAIAEALGLQ